MNVFLGFSRILDPNDGGIGISPGFLWVASSVGIVARVLLCWFCSCLLGASQIMFFVCYHTMGWTASYVILLVALPIKFSINPQAVPAEEGCRSKLICREPKVFLYSVYQGPMLGTLFLSHNIETSYWNPDRKLANTKTMGFLQNVLLVSYPLFHLLK